MHFCRPRGGLRCPVVVIQSGPAARHTVREHEESIVVASQRNRSRIVVASILIKPAVLHNRPWYGDLTLANHIEYCAKHRYDYAVRTRPYQLPRHRNRSEDVPRWAKPGKAGLSWSKIRLVYALLVERGHALAFWTDADSLFTHCAVPVESLISTARLARAHEDPGPELVFVGDRHVAINGGQFLLRRSEWATAFLHRVLSHRVSDTRTAGCGWWLFFEQAALAFELAAANDTASERERCHWLMRSNVGAQECAGVMAWFRPDIRAHVQCLPSQRALNSYHRLAADVLLSDQEAWQPGDYRLHVPGFDRGKLKLLRDASANVSRDERFACGVFESDG